MKLLRPGDPTRCGAASVKRYCSQVLLRRRFLAAGLGLVACQQDDRAYPSREIKLVVQASPGGLSDTVSRVIASLAEPELGVPVVCENRPGAAGALAFSYVTRRQPDGYTIGHGPVEISMVRALGFADVGPSDMDLLCLVTKTQPVLAVHADAPWDSYDAFVGAVRERPGYFVVANSGTGSIWHINALLFEREARLQFVHCPFGGSSSALTALLGTHVDAAVCGAGEAAPQVRAGSLRTLAVFDRRRSSLFPDVPAVTELGVEFGAPAWSGFYGPRGIAEDRRARLMNAIRKAFESAEFQRICVERGMEAVFLDEAEFREFALEQARFFETTLPVLMGGSAG